MEVRSNAVADITRAMPVASDVEVFGPALSVIPVEGTAEAVATANASRYGLSGSVFWRDVSRAMAVAMALDTGQVVINGTGKYPRRGGAVWRLQAERDRWRGPVHQPGPTGAEQKNRPSGGLCLRTCGERVSWCSPCHQLAHRSGCGTVSAVRLVARW